MATLALYAVGQVLTGGAFLAIGGLTLPLGSMAFGALGAFLDSKYLIPALFPPPEIQGPRLDGLEVGSSAEGSPAYFTVGTRVKVPGQNLWISDLFEKKGTQTAGGKGGAGAGGDYVTYTYSAHAAICYSWNKTHEVSRVLRIWADGKVIYKAVGAVNYSSTEISCYPDEDFQLQAGSPPTVFGTYYLDIHSPVTGPDLSEIQSGETKLLEVGGWSNSVNNSLSPGFQVVNSGTGKKNGNGTDGGTWVRVRLGDDNDPGPPVGVQENAGNTITLYQDNPSYSKKKFEELTFYPGSMTQPVDPLMESILGTGNVPAYRGRAYCVFKKFQLMDYGNRMPNFEFELEVDPAETLATGLRKILVRAGLPEEEFDLSDVASADFYGYSVRGPQKGTQTLAPITIAEGILARQRAAKLIFYHRVDAPQLTIADDKLGAYAAGSEPGMQPVSFRDTQPDEMPKRVYVKYDDVDDSFEPGSQVARRYGGRSVQTMSMQYPVTATKANEIAHISMWTTAANSREIVMHLPPSYADVEEGYVLGFNAADRPWNMLSEKVTYGINGIVEVEGVNEEYQTLTYPDAAAEAAL